MSDDANPEIGSLSFLVIEDEMISRKLNVLALEKIGATNIKTVSNGVEALARLESADPPLDVLLVDLSMPEMGGVELLRHLADRGYQGAVILVSVAEEETLAVTEALAKYRNINVLGSITKPIEPQSLVEILARLQ
ncbi:MAG: response regulator [Rhodospirillales bacterium]|jgi:CheY-like chemotaxis protein|nr:response regulator [Rhodospirillales bacterium]MDP6774901.1 response regulator [Rhodospirillales bacterium]